MSFFQSKPAPPPPQTVLGPKTRFEGEVATKRDLEIFGKVNGSAKTEGSLTVQPGATFEGTAACAVFEGKGEVRGEVDATKATRFHPGASFTGTVRYRALAIHPGAKVEGQFKSQTTGRSGS